MNGSDFALLVSIGLSGYVLGRLLYVLTRR